MLKNRKRMKSPFFVYVSELDMPFRLLRAYQVKKAYICCRPVSSREHISLAFAHVCSLRWRIYLWLFTKMNFWKTLLIRFFVPAIFFFRRNVFETFFMHLIQYTKLHNQDGWCYRRPKCNYCSTMVPRNPFAPRNGASEHRHIVPLSLITASNFVCTYIGCYTREHSKTHGNPRTWCKSPAIDWSR